MFCLPTLKREPGKYCSAATIGRDLSIFLLTYLHTYWPTDLPSILHTYLLTNLPTNQPTYLLADQPTYHPTFWSTDQPTYLPTNQPAYLPTCLPFYHLICHPIFCLYKMNVSLSACVNLFHVADGLTALPPEWRVRLKWPVGPDGSGSEGASMTSDSVSIPHRVAARSLVTCGSFNLRHCLCVCLSAVDVDVSSAECPTCIFCQSDRCRPPPLSNLFFFCATGLLQSCWENRASLASLRLALELSPGRGWCRLATGHRRAALVPSSLLLCFPYFPSLPAAPLLPPGLPGMQHLSLHQKYPGMQQPCNLSPPGLHWHF